MVTPETDCFYVTDINAYDDSLEIAVLDDGPSGDYVTYFYRYGGNSTQNLPEKLLVFLLKKKMAVSTALPDKAESMEQFVQIFLRQHT
ncbi:MAG: hypothetical protein ACLVCH_12290 [Roseburia inulinivorans]